MTDRWKRWTLVALLLAGVFVIAFVVRATYRSERASAFDTINPYQTRIAHRQAMSMLDGGGILIQKDADPQRIQQIRRPPGYAIFLASIYAVTGPDLRLAQFVQILIDAIAAAGVAAVACWLLSWRAAIFGGLLYAFSPHLAFYSTVVTPDAAVTWPVLAGGAIYIAAHRREDRWRFALAGAAGVAIGASCWLTAQGMTLPFLLAAAGILIARRGERRRAVWTGTVLAAATVAVISPLTIRNVLVYGVAVPIRPGLGVTLIEGLGVYDQSLPSTDGELLTDEAIRFDRPEYEGALYHPDGQERERDRVRRALDAISHRPVWFLGVMASRIRLMLCYDAEGPPGWPADTAYVGPAEQPAIRFVQRIFFRTWLVWLLIAAGISALVLMGDWRMALLLATIPAHHVLLQSLLLTEYKYTLPIHAWLFILAGAAVELSRVWTRTVSAEPAAEPT